MQRIGTPPKMDSRGRLVMAARDVFQSHGYAAARISDISAHAGVAHGTFYTYFTRKDDVLIELMTSVEAELIQALPDPNNALDDPHRRITESQHAYLAAYRRNAALFAALEEGAHVSDALRQFRHRLRTSLVDRATQAITGWQTVGLIRAERDPRVAAVVLTGMIETMNDLLLSDLADTNAIDVEREIAELSCNALGVTPDRGGRSDRRDLPDACERPSGRIREGTASRE